MTTRIVLVDDHVLVRRGLRALLQTEGRFEVVGEANDGLEALTVLRDVSADIVILDLSMPRMNGLDMLQRLAKMDAIPRILVLSMYGDEQFVAQALAGGARGYLLKHAMDDELFRAIDAVMTGREYVSAAIPREHLADLRASPRLLTPREREVLRLIVEGERTADVARTLGISPHTAVRHVANLMHKLGAHNRAGLVRRATELALLVPAP